MVTSQSGHTTINQKELSVLFSNINFSTSSHVQQQETMTNQDGLQDPHLDTINLYTSEDLKIYNKAIVWLTESVRYDLILYKWTNFYQIWIILYQHSDSKQQFWLWTNRDSLHAATELNEIIMFYPSITQVLVNSHYEVLWDDSSGAGLGRHPTANYE